MNTFSIEAELTYAWNLVKKDWGFFVLLSLVVVTLYVIIQGLASLWANDVPALRILFSILAFIIYLVMEMGAITIGFKTLDGQPKKLADLFRTTKPFGAYAMMTILYSLMVYLGFLLLILPGIYVAIRGTFAGPLLLEKNLGPIEAIKQSFAITKGHFWSLLFMGMVLGLVNVVGVLIVGVGLLLSLPVTLIAFLSIYRKLAHHPAS